MTNQIAIGREAMRSALQLRRSLSIAREEAVNVYDLATSIGVDVMFLDRPSLEGMFVRDPDPLVLVPSRRHRPRGRSAGQFSRHRPRWDRPCSAWHRLRTARRALSAPVKTVNAEAGSRFRLGCHAAIPQAVSGANWLVSARFRGVSESLTSRKFSKKESPRLDRQNRRMFPAMRTSLQTSCERVQLTLTVCLLVACAANMALVYAWL